MNNNPNISGLRPPKKGEVRNPKGRPKGKPLTKLLQEMGEKLAPEQLANKEELMIYLKDFGIVNPTNYHLLMARLYYNAIILGRDKAIEQIMDRIEGKPKETLEIENLENVQIGYSDINEPEDEQESDESE